MSLSAADYRSNYFENIEFCGFWSGFEIPLTLDILCGLYLFYEAGFFCDSPGCPGSEFIDQVGLKVTEIYLPLLLSAGWD